MEELKGEETGGDKDMDFEELRAMKNEQERVNELYRIFDENARLSSRAARVEFMNTVKFVSKYLKPGDRILDKLIAL